ncbi:MAG: DegV family EDD domain-containing protein [Firmicutes bacterium]|nr:DegV family EDD domain-containing protein [Bacillota bacterium]
MKFTIISDSCCDLKHSEIVSDKFDFITVPINITLDEENFLDEESLDICELIKKIKVSKKVGTSCPNPERFYEEMKNRDNIICITLSSKLSGTYNSAEMAKKMALEKDPTKNIFVLDSLTASAGLTLIMNRLMKIVETDDYKDFDDVTKKIASYAKAAKIRFILQDFGVLIKTGRIGKFAGLVASILTLRTICGENGEGEIKMYKKVLGHKKALNILAECPVEKIKEMGSDTPIVITHCNNAEDASFIEKILKSLHGLKNITTYIMRGVASLYASDKGIAIAY